jgi:hypothetical protein
MLEDVKPHGVFGAISILALVALKWFTDAFTGRLSETLLIVAALLLVVVVVDRFALSQTRRRATNGLVRVPASVTPDTAHPFELGVFPAVATGAGGDAAGDTEDGVPPYVSREIDIPLCRELAKPGTVSVIFGPPLSGKTRAAWEAAQLCLQDAKLLVPCTADALTALADSKLALSKDVPILLWLDDCRQYRGAMRADTMFRLLSKWPKMRVLATARTDDYDAMISGNGGDGESGRFLAAAASRFPLADDWTSREADWNERKNPSLDLSNGAARPSAFALDWSGRGGPYRPQALTNGSRPPLPFTHKAGLFGSPQVGWLTGGLIAALVAVVAALLVLWLVMGSFRASPPATVAQQLMHIGGRLPSTQQHWPPAQMKGEGTTSYVFWSRRHTPRGTPDAAAFSDTLRIYDRSGDAPIGPQPTFTYSPRYLSGDPTGDRDRVFFAERKLITLAGDSAQLAGGFWPADQRMAPMLPVIVYWSSRNRWAVQPLSPRPPSLAPAHGTSAKALRSLYLRRDGLVGSNGWRQPVLGYRVQDFAVDTTARNGPRVVFGYVSRIEGRRITQLEVQAWSLDTDDEGNPRLASRCVLGDDPRQRFFVTPIPGLSYPTLLAEYWEQFDAKALC